LRHSLSLFNEPNLPVQLAPAKISYYHVKSELPYIPAVRANNNYIDYQLPPL
jgi:hypothetical protein